MLTIGYVIYKKIEVVKASIFVFKRKVGDFCVIPKSADGILA